MFVHIDEIILSLNGKGCTEGRRHMWPVVLLPNKWDKQQEQQITTTIHRVRPYLKMPFLFPVCRLKTWKINHGYGAVKSLQIKGGWTSGGGSCTPRLCIEVVPENKVWLYNYQGHWPYRDIAARERACDVLPWLSPSPRWIPTPAWLPTTGRQSLPPWTSCWSWEGRFFVCFYSKVRYIWE